MVGFGAVLDKSRRPAWGNAYLDYEGLKTILYRLEEVVVENAARLSFQSQHLTPDFPGEITDEDVRRYSNEFMSKLHSEIEKVTLFCLSRFGDLAHSLGALRFDKDTLYEYPDEDDDDDDVESAKKIGALIVEAENETKGGELRGGLVFNNPGERDALLPAAARRRSYSDMPPSRRRANANLFHNENLSTCNDFGDKFSVYAELGVELLHLLKFSCLNAVGVRFIVRCWILHHFPSLINLGLSTSHHIIPDKEDSEEISKGIPGKSFCDGRKSHGSEVEWD
jgi:hypothetical protein